MNKIYKTVHGVQPPAISKWWTAAFFALMLCFFCVSAKAQTQEHNIIINPNNGGGQYNR